MLQLSTLRKIYRKSAWARGTVFERTFLHPYITSHYGRIFLVNGQGDDGEQNAAFVAMVKGALALIKAKDPRAYRMVQREVRYLLNIILDGGGLYERKYKVCKIDFERYYQVDPVAPEYEWKLAQLACVIVHEATHGRLYSFGIPLNKRTRERVERLCVLRETQFARRLHSDHYDFTKLVPPFDPARWQSYWNFWDRCRRVKKVIALYRQAEEGERHHKPSQ